jgi:hypothetical protein
MFRRAQKEYKEIVGYFDILTPIKDYLNVKFDKEEIDKILKGLSNLCENKDEKRLVLTFEHQGRSVVLLPETLKNSIIEFVCYEKHWWGQKKIK